MRVFGTHRTDRLNLSSLVESPTGRAAHTHTQCVIMRHMYSTYIHAGSGPIKAVDLTHPTSLI